MTGSCLISLHFSVNIAPHLLKFGVVHIYVPTKLHDCEAINWLVIKKGGKHSTVEYAIFNNLSK